MNSWSRVVEKIWNYPGYLLDRITYVLSWIPTLWKYGRDYDFSPPILYFMLYHLQRVIKDHKQTQIHLNWYEDIREMQEVVEHLKRYLNLHEYHPFPYNHDDHAGLKEIEHNGQKVSTFWSSSFFSAWVKNEDKLERWHWSEIWRKIARKGHHWWE